MTKKIKTIALTSLTFLSIIGIGSFFSHPAFAEALGVPHNWQLGFQDSATLGKDEIGHFHDRLLMPIIGVIVALVVTLLLYVIIRYRAKANPNPAKFTHNTLLEVVWTLIPVMILIIIIVPSMRLLYFTDKVETTEMALKITGYQWYWGYEYPDYGDVSLISNMVADADLKEGQPRLLATDNPVVLPVNTNILLQITANDVLHSWAVPAFGIKTDAVPGQTNEAWINIKEEGTYYGQCSELCGVNHSFMPIEIKAVSKAAFADWIQSQGGTLPSEQTEAPDADTSEGAVAPEASEASEAPEAIVAPEAE